MQVGTTALNESAKERLLQIISRVENLEEEKAEVANQVKDVYAEAKAMGYDVKALREIVKMRKKDRNEREEFEAILDVYLNAIGEI